MLLLFIEGDLLSSTVRTNEYASDEVILLILGILDIPIRVGKHSVPMHEINPSILRIESNAAFPSIKDVIFGVEVEYCSFSILVEDHSNLEQFWVRIH